MRVLFFGDVIGQTGIKGLGKYLAKHSTEADFIFVNGENASGGRGITKKEYYQLRDLGVDGLTTGNHVFDKRETYGDLKGHSEIIRPLNYPVGVPGKGYHVFKKKNKSIGVVSLCARVFMKNLDCPFKRIDGILGDLRNETDTILVDFHGEATAEKKALGYFLDGRVTGVLGTHTHTQTNDPSWLPKKTFFLTDLGMVGAKESILGSKKDGIINHFLTGLPFRVEVEDQGAILVNGVSLEVENGIIKDFKLINELV